MRHGTEMHKFPYFCVCSAIRLFWKEVLRSLYPGCPFEREVLGLELVQLVLSELVPVDGTNGADQRESPLAKVRVCVCLPWIVYILRSMS